MTGYFGGWPRGSLVVEAGRMKVLFWRAIRKAQPPPLKRRLLALAIEERDRRRNERWTQ